LYQDNWKDALTASQELVWTHPLEAQMYKVFSHLKDLVLTKDLW
jgi:hypothetical protein